MSRLIVLSNRVSLPDPESHAAGGLAVALQDALDDIGGIWLGWNGQKIEDNQDITFLEQTYQQVSYLTCPLKRSHYQHYYSGYANSVLWPAMHNREDLIEIQDRDYEIYQQVNLIFAEKLAEITQPDDIIWVHDYHFLSVAHHCRKLGMQNRIGFFLHIPFAPAKMWNEIPQSKSLLHHLTEYDIVGLQTERDHAHCRSVIIQALGCIQIDTERLSLNQHLTRIKCYPIGVNPKAIQRIAKCSQPNMSDFFEANDYGQSKTIIGVDRIDYSKGLLERFTAFEAYLKKHPEMYQQITDLQIACPCRMEIAAYEELYENLNHQINRINNNFAQDEWRPVSYTNDTVDHDSLMQLYRFADVCWISSLRDGMNLVAKEYIAAQDPHNPGVLILSKYTGAAEQMSEAIIVDPEDCNAMVKALEKALVMSRTERLERYQQLIQGINSFDIIDWRNAFLDDLEQSKNDLREHLVTHKVQPSVVKIF